MDYKKIVSKKDLDFLPLNYQFLKPVYAHRGISKKVIEDEIKHFDSYVGTIKIDAFSSTKCVTFGLYKEISGVIKKYNIGDEE